MRIHHKRFKHFTGRVILKRDDFVTETGISIYSLCSNNDSILGSIII